MFFSSIFSNIKSKSSFLGLAVSSTFATLGAVTSYYLFKGENNKEKLEKLSADFRKAKDDFHAEMVAIKDKAFAEQFVLLKEQTKLEKITVCVKNEMEKHDKEWGVFTSKHTPNIAKCNDVTIV